MSEVGVMKNVNKLTGHVATISTSKNKEESSYKQRIRNAL